jgi:hypothetical protein
MSFRCIDVSHTSSLHRILLNIFSESFQHQNFDFRTFGSVHILHVIKLSKRDDIPLASIDILELKTI